MVAAAIGIGTAVAGLGAAAMSSNASRAASNAQERSAQSGIDEQRYQFDAIRQLLAPYMQAGGGALTGEQNLLGLNGGGPQASAIAALQKGPQFQAMLKQGQTSILQNASATGGLRGGNVQAALGQFSPMLLSSLIQQQIGNYSGLIGIGQNAAAGVGNAGMQTGQGIAGLLQQQGAAAAGGIMGQGAAGVGAMNSIGQGFGAYMALRQPTSPGLSYDYSNTYNPGQGGFGYKNGIGGF
jgi:hypothetical protein